MFRRGSPRNLDDRFESENEVSLNTRTFEHSFLDLLNVLQPDTFFLCRASSRRYDPTFRVARREYIPESRVENMPVFQGKPNGFPHGVNVRTQGGALFEIKLESIC